MTIIINGHDYKYETESLVKLFYPCQKINIEYDTNYFDRDDIIITRIKKGLEKTYVLVIVKSDGKILKYSKSFYSNIGNYKLKCKKILGMGIYSTLKNVTGVKPKWGIITGIRPVKRIFKYREEHMTDNEIYNYLENEYFVDSSKIELAIKTANNQEQTIKRNQSNSFSLYVSIPFCKTRCSYCSFVSHSIDKAEHLMEEYIKNLCYEIEYTAKLSRELNLKLMSIYIGGGTPTSIRAEDLLKVTEIIKEQFDLSDEIEYTIEAGRADTITKEKLEVIKNSGATRISINPQTFNDDVLESIGRKHTGQDVIDCYFMARDMGFNNINMDFIAGLPNDNIESFKNSIDKAIELNPENITIHTLSIKRASKMYSDNYYNGNMNNSIIDKMVEYGQKRVMNNGYIPYYLYRQKNTLDNLENVGYSKKGYVCEYNIFMMEEIHTILGVGAGGVTKLIDYKTGLIERVFNYKYPYEYNNNFNEIIDRKRDVIKFYAKNNK